MMIRFNNDYNCGAHPQILQALMDTNTESYGGYGIDPWCEKAEAEIKKYLDCPEAKVHFMIGGTQVNYTVISALLRPHQSVISAATGHINVHETGAVEATGHKVLPQPSDDGQITAKQVRDAVISHRNDSSFEHIVQPKLVYISNPTELGTIYKLAELEELAAVCREYGLYLFLDGARLGYGLAAADNDVTMKDLTRLCDAFYIGGTKVGAMFGEAVVIPNCVVAEDFRYLMKQRGAMLAKGWLLGVQYEALMENDLYFEISAHADRLADQIRGTLNGLGYKYITETTTNQIFPVLPDRVLEALAKDFTFAEMGRIDADHRAVRFCTSWATKPENVDALCDALKKISGETKNS